MSKAIVLSLALACAYSAAPAHAEIVSGNLHLNGSVRARYEAIGGQVRPGFNSDDDLFNLRTTLGAEYRGSGWRIGGEIYDGRVYGQDRRSPVSNNEVNAFELVQAFVPADLTGIAGEGSTLGLQGGRMLLNLGSRRLVAADDYRNTTNSYTGVRADLSARGGVHATLIYTLPQMRRPDDVAGVRHNRVHLDRESFDLVLWGGLISRAKALGPAMVELSYFHLGERDAPLRPTRNRSLDTFGGRIIADPSAGKLDGEAEAFYQWGEVRTSMAPAAPVQQVSAWFAHADVGYTFAAPWKPRLSAEFDAASGDKGRRHYARFDTLFGMRRADFAPAGLYSTTGRANIVSPGLRLEAVPSAKTDWFASVRPMWLESAGDSFSTSAVRDVAGRSGSFAGTQIDARLRHLLARSLRLELDTTLLMKGHFLRNAPNAPPSRTARYGSVNLTWSL